jgi:hypothetical protein
MLIAKSFIFGVVVLRYSDVMAFIGQFFPSLEKIWVFADQTQNEFLEGLISVFIVTITIVGALICENKIGEVWPILGTR